MKRSNLARNVLFACVFCVSGAALAPASLLGLALERASGGTLMLAEPRGTAWSGSGVILFRHDRHFVSLGQHRWHAMLSRLAFGKLSYAVQQGQDSSPMTITLAPFRAEMYLTNLHASLPVQVLETVAPQLRPYQLAGALELWGDNFRLSGRGMQGKLSMKWQQAGSGLSNIYPLGDYRLALEGEGSRLDLQLTTESGVLLLSGQGQLEEGRGLTFNGTARAAPDVHAEGLSEMLRHIGPQTAPGVYALTLLPQGGRS